MEKDDLKYFQIDVRIYEKEVFDRFKEFLNNANLYYTYTYNPIGQFWKVFINVEGIAMKKVVYSVIETFIENERYIRGDGLYERKW